ncbi:MAG: ribosomal protein S18-alanine N-acetyltransferase [Clostridia bacterium]|nr:ribosomal protein S18-alanine N-acetyltransferase [Clostridia bacterium]
MIIRRSLPTDAKYIAALEEEIFSDPWSETDIMTAITSSGAMCYSALGDDGELYAYLIGRMILPEGEIYRVATLPSRRQRGIAHRLLSYALKTEMGHGLETVFLEVRSKNIAARKLYSSLYFTDAGIRKNYYKNPPDDAIIMLRTSGEKE